jgi:hypothetical protein
MLAYSHLLLQGRALTMNEPVTPCPIHPWHLLHSYNHIHSLICPSSVCKICRGRCQPSVAAGNMQQQGQAEIDWVVAVASSAANALKGYILEGQ